jgi:hypothetical protein
MSSPVVFPGTPQWPGSAQQQTPQADGNDNEEPGVTVKPMRRMYFWDLPIINLYIADI